MSLRANRQLLAWLLLLLLSLIWGSSFIVIKKGLQVFSPIQLAGLRIFIAFLVQFPFALANLKVVKKTSDWKYLVLSGILANFFPSFLFAIAGAKIDSSLSGALNALTPIFTLLTGWYFFKQPVSVIKVIGLLTGFTGALLLILSRSQGFNAIHINPHAFWVMIATFAYGTNINILHTKLSHIPSVYISFLSSLPIGVLAILVLIFSDIFVCFQVAGVWQAVVYVSFLGIFGTAIGTILFNQLIKVSSSLFASSVTYIIPLVALCWGWLDGESLNGWHIAGIIVVLLGIILVNNGERLWEMIFKLFKIKK